MSAEGWICPLCRSGVAPSETRCPCAAKAEVHRQWYGHDYVPPSGQVTFGASCPSMEPPFDWIAAIENVHVGPMVEVVDGEARAIEPK